MTDSLLTQFSNQLADAVTTAALSVVQVHGRRQPASGVVYDADTIVTTTRAVGGEEGVSARTPDGRALDVEVVGWDPATHLVALRSAGHGLQPALLAPAPPRVGHLALAVGRSWSNALTATTGVVSVIGGPLATGRDLAIAEIIRTTAPMHRGFAGGALADTEGRLLGVATAAEIRGFGVVIPSRIVQETVANLLRLGRTGRGYLGVAGQAVRLPAAQRSPTEQSTGVLVIEVSEGSPAEAAGLLVGDILLAVDDVPLPAPGRLLEALAGRAGTPAAFRVLRGGTIVGVTVALGDRRVLR